MATSQDYLEFVAEALKSFGPINARRMFGGAGVYYEGLMFGLIAGDQLYFKVDDQNRPDFEAEGCGPFIYESKNGKKIVMSYCLAPAWLYEDLENMADWARKAFEAALRADAKKNKAKKQS